MSDRYLRLPEVLRLTGLCRSTIWKYEHKTPPDFPIRVIIGPRTIGWLQSEVDEWLRRRSARRPRRDVA